MRNARVVATMVPLLTGLLVAPAAHGRNLMSADGPGDTYERLRQAYTIEVPDCAHMVPHITEERDRDLGRDVFVFHAHVNEDDDRCRNFDRQRTEIRASAPDIVAREGETLYYSWKFRLPVNFQASANFTHIFQIKSDLDPPIITLCPRRDQIATDGRIGVHATTGLGKFIGVWVEARLRIVYRHDGEVDLTVRRWSDGEVLFSYVAPQDMWDDNAAGHDIKFGIYRSLNSKALLRDEQVKFADFCASKVGPEECDDDFLPPIDDPVDGQRGWRTAGAGGCTIAERAPPPQASWVLALAMLAAGLRLLRRRR